MDLSCCESIAAWLPHPNLPTASHLPAMIQQSHTLTPCTSIAVTVTTEARTDDGELRRLNLGGQLRIIPSTQQVAALWHMLRQAMQSSVILGPPCSAPRVKGLRFAKKTFKFQSSYFLVMARVFCDCLLEPTWSSSASWPYYPDQPSQNQMTAQTPSTSQSPDIIARVGSIFVCFIFINCEIQRKP